MTTRIGLTGFRCRAGLKQKSSQRLKRYGNGYQVQQHPGEEPGSHRDKPAPGPVVQTRREIVRVPDANLLQKVRPDSQREHPADSGGPGDQSTDQKPGSVCCRLPPRSPALETDDPRCACGKQDVRFDPDAGPPHQTFQNPE